MSETRRSGSGMSHPLRQDAIIAHEFEEGIRGSHEAALEHAPEAGLSIKEEARRLLRAQRDRSL